MTRIGALVTVAAAMSRAMSRRVETLPLPGASPGTARTLRVFRYGTPGARPKAYLQAAMHADELPAMLVAHHLVRRLDALHGQVTGEIVVLPAANPIGLGQVVGGHHAGRYELGGAGNFNRGWPDLTDAVAGVVEGRLCADADANVATIRAALLSAVAELDATSELSALRRAVLALAIDADIVLDMHCDLEALLHLYLGTPLWPDARDLAAQLGSAATLLAEDSGGGAFDEMVAGVWWRLAARVGAATPVPPACLAATIEYRGQAEVDDALAADDADRLIRFLTGRGVLAGESGTPPPLSRDASPLTAVDTLRAPVAGLIAYAVTLGDAVAAGDLIAEIVDPAATDASHARTPVVTRTDGVVLSRQHHKLVRPGATVAKVAGTVPLPHRRTGALLED